MPDAVTFRGLRYVKHTFQRARELSSRDDRYSRAMCIHRLDTCVEWVLNMACDYFGRNGSSKMNTLLQRVESEVGDDGFLFPLHSRITSLRSHRNNVQHDMAIPDQETCDKYTEFTHEFLRDVTDEVWGTDFDDFRLADLIEHNELQQLVERAEDLIEENQYSEAVGQCIDVFNYVVNGAEDEEEWEGLVGRAGLMTVTFAGGRNLFEPLDAIDTDDADIEELRSAIRDSLQMLY